MFWYNQAANTKRKGQKTMTIETANRLVELRKKNNLSQEELAEKLGVSRQAVSKWERSEASPDTDNLIALAEIYGMSLDELIFGEKRGNNAEDDKSEKRDGEGDKIGKDDAQTADEDELHVHVNGKERVKIKTSGIYAESKDGDKVKIGPGGIFINSEDGDKVKIGLSGIRIRTSKKDDEDEDDFDDDFDEEFDEEFDEDFDDSDGDGEEHGVKAVVKIDAHTPTSLWLALPYPVLCAAAYLFFGFCDIFGGWALSWIIFITVPIYYNLVEAISKRRFSKFSFAIPSAFAYLYIGLYHGIWHPTWLIFFAIPILDPMMRAIDKRIKHRGRVKKSAQDDTDL